MKSNTSPSAPLNLCAPVGVTGTTLPASPEGVACVPAGNHCLALNSKNNTFALVSTDAAAAIMSMGSVEGFNGVNHSLKTLDKVVIRQEGKKCRVDIHKGASVFSSLPSGRVEAKKLAAQLASLYSAPLFNVKESGKVEAVSLSPAEPVKAPASPVKDTPENEPVHCLCECGQVHPIGEDCPAPASPVDSVGVPALPFAPRPWLTDSDDAERLWMFDGYNRMFRVRVEFPSRQDLPPDAEEQAIEHIKDCVNSHAAKDAKIKELESLLLECVRDMTAAHIVDNILYKEKNPTRPQLPEPASLIAARAALALPCAPQES